MQHPQPKVVWGGKSSPLRVLIVEDNADTRGMLTFACEVHGHVVAQAANGLQALDQLQEGPRPDVILLDLTMPVMDGWQFRKAQQACAKWAGIPVVVVTAHEDPGALAAIAPCASFRKPIDVDSLLETLDTIRPS
jgi:CheY-like chemotaxis protein